MIFNDLQFGKWDISKGTKRATHIKQIHRVFLIIWRKRSWLKTLKEIVWFLFLIPKIILWVHCQIFHIICCLYCFCLIGKCWILYCYHCTTYVYPLCCSNAVMKIMLNLFHVFNRTRTFQFLKVWMFN